MVVDGLLPCGSVGARKEEIVVCLGRWWCLCQCHGSCHCGCLGRCLCRCHFRCPCHCHCRCPSRCRCHVAVGVRVTVAVTVRVAVGITSLSVSTSVSGSLSRRCHCRGSVLRRMSKKPGTRSVVQDVRVFRVGRTHEQTTRNCSKSAWLWDPVGSVRGMSVEKRGCEVGKFSEVRE